MPDAIFAHHKGFKNRSAVPIQSLQSPRLEPLRAAKGGGGPGALAFND